MGRERNGGESSARPVDARVARRRQDPIGRKLRKIYTDVVEESVPDEFLAILEEAETRKGDSDDGGGGMETAEAGAKATSSQPER